ncbi:chromatin spt2 [Trichoderma arundinaceum]|uniref:Chromatin spt2 n=1 Tax=Trichoderma arundinaceum TaxID=490622 RepID=A0A395NJ99_TRIAR|nr:chromatin spt2 [Trichoderma arundinaceum]
MPVGCILLFPGQPWASTVTAANTQYQIGDLLAQISGGKSSDSPAPAVQRPQSVSIKRKADDNLARNDSKTPRLFAQPAKVPQRPAIATLPRPLPIPSKPVDIVSRPVRPVAASKPPAPPPVAPSKPKAPPKKGSYAEILARAQRAQAVMGQVGKIQHKKVEKGAIKKDKERSDVKAAPQGSQGRKPPIGYKGSSKPGQRNGTNGNATSKVDRNGAASRPPPKALGSSKKAPEPEPEKKLKKAAVATTGYTGTARPKPGAASKKSNAPRGGALLNAPPPRSGSSRRSRFEDDYDEEMDDFIDYDDEEEEDGQRYGYASDGSSDMEAGLDDIDDEERLAEQIARREDLQEERLEKSLKVAKEERKRKALEALRANRRG